LGQIDLNALPRKCSNESKQFETKAKTLFRSTNFGQPTIQRKPARAGVSMAVGQFRANLSAGTKMRAHL
jgi:hypothetical protein